MSDLRTAAQQALEALEEYQYKGAPFLACDGAVAALRAALAQEEQEPVAWMVYTEDGKSAYVTDNPHDLVGAYKAFALYTHPPRREWQRLTEEDMEDLLPLYSDPNTDAEMLEFASAIEVKLKEKNNG